MKKLTTAKTLTCLCLALFLAGLSLPAAGGPPDPALTGFDLPAPAGILTDAVTGLVLWAKDADHRYPPASITKLTQLLLVMEALDSGRIHLTDKVTASHRAATFGGSSMWVKEGEVFTVDDLLKAVAVASANDASVMLAEFLAGSEEGFAEQMNRRVEALGLKNSHYINSMGLPAPKGQQGDYSTAADIAVVAREVLKHPQVLRYTSLQKWEIRGGKNKFDNTNHLLERYQGADGLKTGHTEEAGWSLAATAQRGDLRLIAVILKASSDAERVEQCARLLDYGYSHFAPIPVVKKGAVVGTFDVPRAGRSVVAVAARDLAVVAERGKQPEAKPVFTRKPGLRAPIAAGQEVGEVRLRLADGTLTAPIPATAQSLVKRVNSVVAFLLFVGRWLLHLVTLGRR